VPQTVGEVSASRRRAIGRLSHDAPSMRPTAQNAKTAPGRVVREPRLRNRRGSIDAREASHQPRAVLVSNFLRVCAAILLASAWMEVVPRPRAVRPAGPDRLSPIAARRSSSKAMPRR
jgi:hypothetical protein